MKRSEPIRTCLGCGRRDQKRRLVRFTMSAAGGVVPEPSAGHGGYLHSSRECVTAFVTAAPKRFRKRLRASGGTLAGQAPADFSALAALVGPDQPS